MVGLVRTMVLLFDFVPLSVNYGEYEEGIYERLEDLVIPEMDSEEGVSSSSSDETFEDDGFQGWDQRNKGWDCIGTRTDTTSHYCFPVSTGSADSQCEGN